MKRFLFLASVLLLSISVSGCGPSVQDLLSEAQEKADKAKAEQTPPDKRWVVMYEMGSDVRALVTNISPAVQWDTACVRPRSQASWNGPQSICGGYRIVETTENDLSSILAKYKIKDVD
jgi:hypothetical protein